MLSTPRGLTSDRDDGRLRVRFEMRWFLLLCSLVVVVLLRSHKLALSVYVGGVVVVLSGYAFWLPRAVQRAERRFSRDALRLLAAGRPEEIRGLARRQGLLRRFGPKHLIPDVLGLAASAAGQHEAARQAWLEALRYAPPEDRIRVEVNLAAEEMATGHDESAEGRFRALLVRRPDFPPALANLGRLLARQSETCAEAADLLARALKVCDPRDVPSLRLALAEALVRLGRPEWREVLDAARAEGADPESVERLEARALSV